MNSISYNVLVAESLKKKVKFKINISNYEELLASMRCNDALGMAVLSQINSKHPLAILNR